jgi:hypothetical protein
MRDGGGTLKPYEVREIHAMWDDFIGNDAAAAELRRNEPHRPWTAPSLSEAAMKALASNDQPQGALVLLGGPMPDELAAASGRVETASVTDLNLPIDSLDAVTADSQTAPPRA